MIGEIRFISSNLMVDTVEDWSNVRSPGRARRRRWKHRQNIIYRAVPRTDAIFIARVKAVAPNGRSAA